MSDQNDNKIILSSITMQRLKTIAMAEKKSLDEVLNMLVEERFYAMIPMLDEFAGSQETPQRERGPKPVKRQTDIYLIPTIDPPE